MEQVPFGRTGLHVSRIGFGAGPIGYLGASPQDVGRILNLLLDRGVNLIDTAAAYLGSEELIGAAVGHRRKEYVLLSKCGRKVPGVEGEDWSAGVVSASVDRSLRRLGTDRLDVMLLHSCPLEVLRRGEALGALVKAKEAGKIRFAGYSGDNDAAVYAAGLDGVDVLMCSASLCDQVNLDGALPAAAAKGLGALLKRPVANGAWKPPGALQGVYRDYAKPYQERFQAMGLDPRALGFPGPEAWMEIALRFALAVPGAQVLSIGTTSHANAETNLRLAERGPLAPEAVAAIRKAFRDARARAGVDWPGLT
jgi:aryl-alcohol dehydrogenase-like predicted oxidoreductase